jgi:hypothetical protein
VRGRRGFGVVVGLWAAAESAGAVGGAIAAVVYEFASDTDVQVVIDLPRTRVAT